MALIAIEANNNKVGGGNYWKLNKPNFLKPQYFTNFVQVLKTSKLLKTQGLKPNFVNFNTNSILFKLNLITKPPIVNCWLLLNSLKVASTI